jgi:hypothetical protein
MAWSLGSIFVELTCNTAKFLSGMDKAGVAAKKTGKDIRTGLATVGGSLASLGDAGARLGSILEGVGNKAGEAFDVAARKGRGLGGLVAGSLLGGVTALAGGMFALALKTADAGSQIFEASEKTGIGAAQLSGLLAITKQTGGSFEGLTGSLAKAGANLEKAIIAPGGQTAKILAQIMGGAKNLSDLGLKPMADRLQIVLARIFAMNDTGQRNAALSSLLGRGWMENVSSLKLLAEQGYTPAIAQARRLGMFFDDNSARQARQFKAALADMRAEISGLGLSIGQEVVPMFSRLMTAMQGMEPNLKALGLRIMAIEAAVTGVGIPLAIKMWKEADVQANQATQAMTDFLLRTQSLTDGQKANADATGNLTSGLKTHLDVLAALIEREKDELVSLDTLGNKQREAQVEYDRTTLEIQKQIDAGGNYAEGVKAMGLAWDIYRAKYIAAMQESVKVPHGPGVPAAPSAAPGLKMPTDTAVLLGPMGVTGPMPGINETLSQLALLSGRIDSTRGEERALREETELSDASFQKLARAFPGLTEAEVAATAAGRNMIDQLSRMDKLGTLAEQFAEFKGKLIADGDDIAAHLVQTMGGALNQIEDQLAHLAVTGKANFKQLGQGIEESLMKAGLQKGVSSVLGRLGMPGGGGKPDGSSGNPLWVRMANRAEGIPAGLFGAGAKSSPPGVSGAQGVFQQATSSISSVGKIFGSFASIFGGFLASGGDVTPGKAYVVGEKHPEFFIPRASGAVAPSLSAQTLRPLSYSPTFNINTPNADTFRKSQSQILAEGYRTMAQVHGRNS